jgi:hypothetical protein
VARLRSRAGREFVLDAHGLTTLAAPTVLAAGWLEFIFEDFEDSRLWVPELVVIESTSGGPSDANVNRFLKTLDDPRHPGRSWLSHERQDLSRAAALRHDAVAAGRDRISATDALIVAMSERLSMRRGVTILTSDPGDLSALMAQTGRPNMTIAVVDRA